MYLGLYLLFGLFTKLGGYIHLGFKDIVLHNHSNLKTPSQRLHAFNSIQQKPDEALQTYNSWYESHF